MRFEAERIAIVKLGAIGDVVNSLPCVNRLRDGYPRARITWVIAPLAHALVAGHRAVDEFLVVDVKRSSNWRGIVRELRARRFDLALDLQRILKSGVLTRATGARVRVGFDRARCKEGAWLFSTARIPPNPAPGVTVAQYLEFADFLGCPRSAPRFDLPFEPFPPRARGETRVAVHIGATKNANRWYPDKWAALCTRLVEECGATLHMTGGANDAAEIEDIVARCASIRDRIVVQAGKLSLQQTAGLLATCNLFVGGDTGPLHMAVAVGTPVVALFGAADPARTGPFGAADSIVSHPVPCSPCRRRECNVAGHPCMRDLEVAAVFERARVRLG